MTHARAGTTVAATQQLLHIVAVCVGCGLAHIGTSTMPFQIGALVDGAHRSASEAGLFGFIQVGALAAGMILICSWVDRIPPRRIAVGSCLLATLANMGLYFLHSLPLQLVFAAAAGLGYGFVFAATVSGAAATREPDRVYAIGNGGALLIVVGLMAVLPVAGARLGALGIFAALAALATVASPFFMGFTTGRRTEETRLAVWRIAGAPGLLFAWAAFSTGTGALYAFSERIGKSINLPPAQIALVLSAGVFVGLIGTGIAALLGRRVNRPWALIIGMCGSGLSCLLLGFAGDLLMFAAGVFVYWVFYMFLYSYLLGTAAVLDPAGRVGTLGGGMERLGYGVGAGIGGLLAEHATYSSTGVLGFLGCALGLALGFPSLFQALKIRGTVSVQPSPANILPP
jgi:predicted MFS family arabinose efflux permease